jgi:hypothetical protein
MSSDKLEISIGSGRTSTTKFLKVKIAVCFEFKENGLILIALCNPLCF